jgi:hypothetical protein
MKDEAINPPITASPGLLPCPDCGCTNILLVDALHRRGRQARRCAGCGLSTGFYDTTVQRGVTPTGVTVVDDGWNQMVRRMRAGKVK